jgi:GNAT superfamily N-acetyltransferase
MGQLQRLFDSSSFWARGRRRSDLQRMLRGSQVAVSAWSGRELIGFGRATSDGVYRALLWDVVVHAGHQGQGLGRRVVQHLLASRSLRGVERVYLMTTNSAGFYQRLGFEPVNQQLLMHIDCATRQTPLLNSECSGSG